MVGLNRAEAAQDAGHLLARYAAARERRERRSFGDLLEWLDGHPLAMRLTLPRLDTTDPADLLAALQGTTPCQPRTTQTLGGRRLVQLTRAQESADSEERRLGWPERVIRALYTGEWHRPPHCKAGLAVMPA